LADRVLDILSFEANQVQPVPQIARSSRVDFLSGLVTVDGTMIALVDLPNLLAEQFAGADTANPEQRSAAAV
jgi:purine-binding chemotaxis protein CheW